MSIVLPTFGYIRAQKKESSAVLKRTGPSAFYCRLTGKWMSGHAYPARHYSLTNRKGTTKTGINKIKNEKVAIYSGIGGVVSFLPICVIFSFFCIGYKSIASSLHKGYKHCNLVNRCNTEW